jgi:hypothetical protein
MGEFNPFENHAPRSGALRKGVRMKIRLFLAISVGLMVFAAGYATDRETGIGGKWATDPVRTARPDTTNGGIIGRVLQSASDVATQQVPTGRGGGGAMGGPRRGVQIDTSAPLVVEKGSSPDGVALIMELKLNKEKLTGKVTEVVSGSKFDVETAAVMGNKLQFLTYKKVMSIKVETVYKGELVDESTLAITRWTASGKPVDLKEDGSAETLIFKRSK